MEITTTPGPRELFPWINQFESHLEREDKVIVVPIRKMGKDNLPIHANRGGFVDIMKRNKLDSQSHQLKEVDLMRAITRGLVSFDKKTDEIIWGGVMRYSIKLNKL